VKGFFAPNSGNTATPVFICEGVLDALSLRSAGLSAITTNGSTDMTALHAFLVRYKAKGYHLVTAFDNDDAGAKMAQVVMSWDDVGASYAKPVGKDWNDDLLAMGDKFDPLRDVVWAKGSPGYVEPTATQDAQVTEQRAAVAPTKPRRMVR
jgi:DNA primase